MEEALTRSRASTAVRGLLALGLGVLALAWPKMTLAFLIVAFATYAIADGIFTLSTAFGPQRDEQRTVPLVLEGLVSLAAGLFVLFATATALKLAFVFIGLWAIFTGVLQLVEGPRTRGAPSESMVMVSGLLRILLGIILVARPHAPLRAAVWLVAIYAFAEGILMLRMAFTGRARPLTPRPA
jgi:uncharacterized membrane protein HdeD (DUF308 family)